MWWRSTIERPGTSPVDYPKTAAILDIDREYNASSSTSSNAALPTSIAPDR
jgi:hypothetical protein